MPKEINGKGKQRARSIDKPQAGDDDQPERIPRPPNSWILFRRHFNEQLKKDPEGSSGVHQHTVSGDASKAWKSLSRKEKMFWEAKAKEADAEHKIQYPGYQYQPRKKNQRENQKEKEKEKEKEKSISKEPVPAELQQSSSMMTTISFATRYPPMPSDRRCILSHAQFSDSEDTARTSTFTARLTPLTDHDTPSRSPSTDIDEGTSSDYESEESTESSRHVPTLRNLWSVPRSATNKMARVHGSFR